MKRYRGYLIDLDGTMYRGIEKIDAAVTFFQALKKQNIAYRFVTNNSSKTPAQVVQKLRSFGIFAEEKDIITSSMATAKYIAKQNPHASVYFIGEEGLRHALEAEQLTITDDSPDYVVVGIDRAITYEKLAKACLAVRNGATYIITNGDKALPTERGLVPGNGAIASVITASTNIEPIVIGKPERIIMEMALQDLQVPKEEVIMVGDNYETDIRAGINAKIDTLFVHTGVTARVQLALYEKQPTYVIDSLAEWRLE